MASSRRAFLVDLFDTLVVIDTPTYNEGRRALAAEVGVAEAGFLAAWRATDTLAQNGGLPDTVARWDHDVA